MKPLIIITTLLFGFSNDAMLQRIMEHIDRGVIALNAASESVFISWRLLNTDPQNVSFDLYRSTRSGDTIKLNNKSIQGGTWFIDTTASVLEENVYYINPSNKKPEFSNSNSYVLSPSGVKKSYLSVPLQIPLPGELNGEQYPGHWKRFQILVEQ